MNYNSKTSSFGRYSVGVKKLINKAIFGSFIAIAMFFIASTAHAGTPFLSVTNEGGFGDNVRITISNANAYSQINLYRRQGTQLWTRITNFGQTDGSGHFSKTVSLGTDGSNSPVEQYVVVGGLQSSTVTTYPYGGGSGCYGYNCGNTGNIWFSPSSVHISVNQSRTVSINSNFGFSNYFISSNSNSNVVSASVSGSTLNLFARNNGSSSITVCQSNNSNCGSILVTVGGSVLGNHTGSITFSPSNPHLNVGESRNVSIFAPYIYSGSYFISSNSNSNVVSATISGSRTINLFARNNGSSTITVCQSGNNVCSSLFVTVGSGGGFGGTLVIDPVSPSLGVGQSFTAVIRSGFNTSSFFVSSNSNSNVVSASVSGRNIFLHGLTAGSSTVRVCETSTNNCGSMFVNVHFGSSGNLSLDPSNITIGTGQSSTISITGASGSFYFISANSNPNVASANISGRSLRVFGLNNGISTITVCRTGGNACASLTVNVTGSGGGTGNFWFSPANPNLNIGQNLSVGINSSSGSSGTYYISNNSNSNVVSASISGNNLNLFGNNFGNSTITVCRSGFNQCNSLLVSVGGSGGNFGNVLLSETNLSLRPGQNAAVSVFGSGSGSFFVSSNSNPSVVSASVTGSSVDVFALNTGSATLSICRSGAGQCASLFVNVSGTGGFGNLSFTTTNIPQFVVGQAYSFQFQATGGVPPYTYNVVSGGVPSGLNLSSSGLLSGVPQFNIATNFTVEVRDIQGRTGTVHVSVSPTGTGGGGGVLGTGISRNGQLINENGTIYIVYKNTKTGFASLSAFRGLGFELGDVIRVSNSGISNSGFIVRTSNAAHPWGSWIKSGQTVYFVHELGLIPVPNMSTLINNGGEERLIVPANSYDFRLSILSPMTVNDSRLR